MKRIVFLPPNFNENHELEKYKEISNNQKDPSYAPKTVINRVHKSSKLVVYEIEHTENDEHDSCCYDSDNSDHSAVICVSSQKNSSIIKQLYKDLRYEPISELKSTSPSNLINIFAVVLEMTFKDEDPKCTTLQMFDFDSKSPILVKLWRGLANWITSLSIGARLQIRNLSLKDSILHSCSTTEIYLLAHGNGIESKLRKSAALSSRAKSLNEKEKEILMFLSHQSLLIPTKQQQNDNVTLKLAGPLYLEHRNNQWMVSDSHKASVTFSYFDAKVWQLLSEIFIDSSGNFDILFDKLRDDYEFTSFSTLSYQISKETQAKELKRLDWSDLMSTRVILFGTFELEAILDYLASPSANEESLGNLSILPHERSTSQSKLIPILRNPKDFSQFVYPENGVVGGCDKLLFTVRIKTLLNDGNVNEIIRKSIFIL